jgi:hypothetical protein
MDNFLACPGEGRTVVSFVSCSLCDVRVDTRYTTSRGGSFAYFIGITQLKGWVRQARRSSRSELLSAA